MKPTALRQYIIPYKHIAIHGLDIVLAEKTRIDRRKCPAPSSKRSNRNNPSRLLSLLRQSKNVGRNTKMAAPQDTVYRGNCVCGRYRYEICLPEVISSASSCTCSVCQKKGYLWLAPPEGSFKVIRDDGCLKQHVSKAISHKVHLTSPSLCVHANNVLAWQFCDHCGIGVVGQHIAGPLSGRFIVNVRTIQGVNPFQLK